MLLIALNRSPAALALALLLGHEARITDEQWSEVRAMDNLCAICGVAPRNPLANVCQSCSDKVEQTRERLISERQTPPPCPACEAAARERDDLHALCDRQAAILSRVAVALRGPEPPLTKWGHHDLPERAAAVVMERDEWEAKYHTVHQHNTMLQEHDYELSVKAEELADLRARIAALCDDQPHMVNTDELRALLAEKEAK